MDLVDGRSGIVIECNSPKLRAKVFRVILTIEACLNRRGMSFLRLRSLNFPREHWS